MTADQFLGTAGKWLAYVGFALVVIALVKFAGVHVEAIPGDYMGNAILGFALRSLR